MRSTIYAAAQFVGPNMAPLTVEAQNALDLAVSKAPGWIYGQLMQVSQGQIHKCYSCKLLSSAQRQQSKDRKVAAGSCAGCSAGHFAPRCAPSRQPQIKLPAFYLQVRRTMHARTATGNVHARWDTQHSACALALRCQQLFMLLCHPSSCWIEFGKQLLAAGCKCRLESGLQTEATWQ